MAEPPVTATPHLPGHPDDQFSDFTHRDYRPDHVAHPTQKGIPYDPFMSPQRAGALLCKVARKANVKSGSVKAGRAKSTTKTVAAHAKK